MGVQTKILKQKYESGLVRVKIPIKGPDNSIIGYTETIKDSSSISAALIGGIPGTIHDVSYGPVCHTTRLSEEKEIGGLVVNQGIIINAPEYGLYGVDDDPLKATLELEKGRIVSVMTMGRVWVKRGIIEGLGKATYCDVLYCPEGNDAEDLCLVEVRGLKKGINKPIVEYPTGTKFTVIGTVQKPNIIGLNPQEMNIAERGDFETEGESSITISLKEGYVWGDGSNEAITYEYTFEEKEIEDVWYGRETGAGGHYKTASRWFTDEARTQKVSTSAWYPNDYKYRINTKGIPYEEPSIAVMDDVYETKLGGIVVDGNFALYGAWEAPPYLGYFYNDTATRYPFIKINENSIFISSGFIYRIEGGGKGQIEVAGGGSLVCPYEMNGTLTLENQTIKFKTTDAVPASIMAFDTITIESFSGGNPTGVVQILLDNGHLICVDPNATSGVEGNLDIQIIINEGTTLTSEAALQVVGGLSLTQQTTISVDVGEIQEGTYKLISVGGKFEGIEVANNATIRNLREGLEGKIEIDKTNNLVSLVISTI